MKISVKLVLFFLIATIIPILVVASISFNMAESSLENETLLTVNENADIQVRLIENFFNERLADAEVSSKIELFKEEIRTLDEFHTSPTNPEYMESARKVNERMISINEAYGYDGLGLLNTEGTIVYLSESGAQGLIGKSILDVDPNTFYKGKEGVYLSEILEDVDGDGSPNLFLAAPLLDDKENFLGILAFDIPFKRLLDRAIQEFYFGETGETVVMKKFGDEAVVLSSLRFDPEGKLKSFKIGGNTAIPAQEATSGIDGSGISIDYRNEEVIAAWRNIPSLDWGLVTKVDTAEAFAPIVQLRENVTILAVVFSIGVGFFGFIASRSFSKPILRLKNLASEISKGNLDAKVKVQSSDEIGQLSKMMNETAEKLKEAQKQKDEFASMITHELKTPLVPIQGYCKILKKQKMGELNEDQLEAVDEIFNNSVELLNLIQNVLNAQKIELHKMKYNIEKIDLNEYMKGRYDALLEMMSEKNTEFINSTEENLSVKGDVARLNEIITNLVQNAVDFVPEEGSRIEMGAKKQENEVLFYVKDNGVGIPKEKIGNMFKKFYQIDTSTTRKHGGSGLGLSICKGYVEDMGGKMWVESEPNVETVFYFTLPS